ncbi:MAG: DUF2784 domain-containing protein [Candidatus Eremiobacteraeota bacterium]|nr:DUF2784 domain-containing protein [Candidatus Eremiobacteraeota bacterium]MCL5056066.1 DUF2784 domain-containing protein [Bacillota bacterium]
MNSNTVKFLYSLAISSVYIIHLIYALTIIVGFILIWIGYFVQWDWVKNFTFRMIHLIMIGIVAVESLFNIECPLTWLQEKLMSLDRLKHGNIPFIAGIVDKILYYKFPLWVFNTVYIVFGVLVLATWFLIPPKKKINRPF